MPETPSGIPSRRRRARDLGRRGRAGARAIAVAISPDLIDRYHAGERKAMPFGETEEGEHFFTLPAGGSGAGKPPKVGSGDTVFLCVAGGVVGRARLSRAGYGKMTCAKTGRTVRGFHLVWKPEDVTSFMDRKRLPAAIGRISSAYGWAPVERGTVDGTPGASRAAEAAPRRSVAIKYL